MKGIVDFRILKKTHENQKSKACKVYIELRNNYLMIYEKAREPISLSLVPDLIIYLDGLYIELLSKDGRKPFGFDISYRNPIYGSFQMIFDEKEEFLKWKSCISENNKNLHEDYVISDNIIGRGRYSVVYKGFPKKNPDKEVAIKMIDREGLSQMEKTVLKYL